MDEFVPRGSTVCGCGWDLHHWLTYLIAFSELGIFVAYLIIPLGLIRAARKFPKAFPFKGIWAMFAAFILSCGLTHFVDALTFQTPLYFLEGWLKAFTACISLTTGVVFWTTTPLIAKRLHDATSAVDKINSKFDDRETKNRLTAFLDAERPAP